MDIIEGHLKCLAKRKINYLKQNFMLKKKMLGFLQSFLQDVFPPHTQCSCDEFGTQHSPDLYKAVNYNNELL